MIDTHHNFEPLYEKEKSKFRLKIMNDTRDRIINFCQKLVFCYRNCSSDREKLLKFEAEGREFENLLNQNRLNPLWPPFSF